MTLSRPLLPLIALLLGLTIAPPVHTSPLSVFKYIFKAPPPEPPPASIIPRPKPETRAEIYDRLGQNFGRAYSNTGSCTVAMSEAANVLGLLRDFREKYCNVENRAQEIVDLFQDNLPTCEAQARLLREQVKREIAPTAKQC